MGLFQKRIGNTKIEGKILKGRKFNYYLNLEGSRFQFYIPRIPKAPLVDLVFHTVDHGDFQIVRITEISEAPEPMNAVNLAEISISYIRNSHTQEGRQYKFESFEPIIRDDSLLGVVTYGKMRQKSGKEFKTLNFFIPMTAEKPNDMMLMLDSWVPVSAPEELFEDVKNILLSVKFTQ